MRHKRRPKGFSEGVGDLACSARTGAAQLCDGQQVKDQVAGKV
jgi:hypothetical protein